METGDSMTIVDAASAIANSITGQKLSTFTGKEYYILYGMYASQCIITYSADGKSWQSYGTLGELVEVPGEKSAQQRQEECTTHLFAVKKSVRAKYFKITAENYGKLPDWHISAGEQAWLFADELVIM